MSGTEGVNEAAPGAAMVLLSFMSLIRVLETARLTGRRE